jgi:RND family efflux transporter MFP subunit
MVLHTVLALAVLAGGVGLFLTLAKREPPRAAPPAPPVGPAVTVMEATPREVPVIITGHGTVRPFVEVQVVPQVGGKVVEVHPQLRPGGVVRKGETLLKIDPSDYELAVRQASGEVAKTRTALELQQAEAQVAREEWRDIHGERPAPPLVAREPQIRQAEAELEAARARLARAELDLKRTSLTAPVDARVVQKSVDVGQYVTPGAPLASLYGTQRMEVVVPLEDRQLAWFDLATADRPGSPVTLKANFGGSQRTWAGRAERLEGQVDANTRMVNLVVAVDQPASGDGSTLLPNQFVTAMISGNPIGDVVVLPRYAIRVDGRVWVASPGEGDASQLRFAEVEVIRREADSVFVRGLSRGDRIVTSSLDVATEGMLVRPFEARTEATVRQPKTNGAERAVAQ